MADPAIQLRMLKKSQYIFVFVHAILVPRAPVSFGHVVVTAQIKRVALGTRMRARHFFTRVHTPARGNAKEGFPRDYFPTLARDLLPSVSQKSNRMGTAYSPEKLGNLI